MATVMEMVLYGRGVRQSWLAEQLGISEPYLSRLLSGERLWTPELKAEAARLLMLPEELLFSGRACRVLEDRPPTD